MTRGAGNFPAPPLRPAPRRAESTGDKSRSPGSGSHRVRYASPPASRLAPATAAATPRAEPHGPHRAPRSPAPRRRAAAPAPGPRRPARRRGARRHRAALPVPADRAGHSPQEHPERQGDAVGPPLHPHRSHSHPQERTRSLSQPRSPHCQENHRKDAKQGQHQLTWRPVRSWLLVVPERPF